MATIKDIARLAGVSHGTVSNVLNSRGNVSAAKISAVKAAVKQLGYQVNTQAKILRGGASKSIALILPDIASEQYHHLYNGLNRCLLDQDYRLELFSTYDREEVEKKQLANLATRQYEGVVAVSCLPDANFYYEQLKIPSAQIIFVYRRPDNAERFFDVDRFAAARHFAVLILQQQFKNVAYFSEQASGSATSDFSQHLQQALSSRARLRVITSSAAETAKTAYALLAEPQPDAVICSDFDRVRHVKNAFYLGSRSDCPPIYTLSGEELRLEPGLYCYAVNYQELGKKVAQSLTRHPERSSLAEPAINDDYKCVASVKRPARLTCVINLLTIPSPSTEALEKLIPHFYRMTGIEVKITRKPFDRLTNAMADPQSLHAYDLVRIDMATFPALAEKIFEPLANLSPDLLTLLDQFPAHLIGRYSEIKGQASAIPFDPSMQMLFYRRDIFADQQVRRIYYEKFRQEMTLPVNFEQYDRLSAFFTELYHQGETKTRGSCVTTGGTETIASEFMLRYYAKGGRLLHKNGPARLDLLIATETLYAYLGSLKHNLSLRSNWWQEAVACFERGEIAMLIVYTNLFSEVAHGEIAPLTGYAAVPGGTPLLGGGSIGVAKSSRQKAQAATFLKWLFSPTIIEQLVLLGGSSASTVQYQNPVIKEAYPWLRLARHASINGIRESYTPDGDYFDLHSAEKIIGRYVSAAILSELNVKEAINQINEGLFLLQASNS